MVDTIKIKKENEFPPTDMAIVFFDTETSRFTNAEILQIGAKCGKNYLRLFLVILYICYILPQNEISAKAIEIHRLFLSNGNLMKNNSYIPSVQLKDALDKFLHFLIAIDSPCLLVEHNINFAARHFLRVVCLHKMENDFHPWLYGFADSLQILKKLVTNVTNYKLSTLAEKFDLQTEEIHHALVDAKLVEQIFEKIKIPISNLILAFKLYNWHLNRQAELFRKVKNLGSLQVLEGIVLKTMRGKMAEQGILIENLKETFITSGVDGIKMLLGESVNGKSRVTKYLRIINKIGTFMEEHIQNMQIN